MGVGYDDMTRGDLLFKLAVERLEFKKKKKTKKTIYTGPLQLIFPYTYNISNLFLHTNTFFHSQIYHSLNKMQSSSSSSSLSSSSLKKLLLLSSSSDEGPELIISLVQNILQTIFEDDGAAQPSNGFG
ncbi:hypothetical protein HanOQP8_Chr12g0448041 [Helianthus annuus]|nr:hypothetical protein HanOQP8_Chr12g0448041 [Helianthus annuus]